MQIISEYDSIVNAFIVKMPEYINYDALEVWKSELLLSLSKVENQIALLIDINRHNFESIECLKLLRNMFDESIVKEKVLKTAFVCPKKYKESEVVSNEEAYFEKFNDAYCWLQ